MRPAMRRARGRRLTIALLALGAVACHSAAWSAEDLSAPLPDVSAGVQLVVHNNRGGSVNVSVAHALDTHGFDVETRVGLVDAGVTDTFRLDPNLWDSSPIAVIATPTSGFDVSRSASFNVFGGSTITFTVEPDPRRSRTAVR